MRSTSGSADALCRCGWASNHWNWRQPSRSPNFAAFITAAGLDQYREALQAAVNQAYPPDTSGNRTGSSLTLQAAVNAAVGQANFSLTDEQSRALVAAIAPQYEATVNNAVPNFPNSQERVAFLTMAYGGGN